MAVALTGGMTARQAETAMMTCRMCGGEVKPDCDSSAVMAWYTCPVCDVTWSARLRNGRPDMGVLPIDVSSLLSSNP